MIMMLLLLLLVDDIWTLSSLSSQSLSFSLAFQWSVSSSSPINCQFVLFQCFWLARWLFAVFCVCVCVSGCPLFNWNDLGGRLGEDGEELYNGLLVASVSINAVQASLTGSYLAVLNLCDLQKCEEFKLCLRESKAKFSSQSFDWRCLDAFCFLLFYFTSKKCTRIGSDGEGDEVSVRADSNCRCCSSCLTRRFCCSFFCA